MSLSIFSNPSFNKNSVEIQAKPTKCKCFMLLNVLWSTYTSYTSAFIRALVRYSPDLNQTELDFRDSAIDIGKQLDQCLQQNALPYKITERNESIFSKSLTSLRKENLTAYNRLTSRFNTKTLTAGLLATLFLQDHITYLKKYTLSAAQKSPLPSITEKDFQEELNRIGRNYVKLHIKVSKWKGDDINKTGVDLWKRQVNDQMDLISEEVRKDYSSSNKAATKIQASSHQMSEYFYKVVMGCDPYYHMDSGNTFNPNIVEFTEEGDF